MNPVIINKDLSTISQRNTGTLLLLLLNILMLYIIKIYLKLLINVYMCIDEIFIYIHIYIFNYKYFVLKESLDLIHSPLPYTPIETNHSVKINNGFSFRNVYHLCQQASKGILIKRDKQIYKVEYIYIYIILYK